MRKLKKILILLSIIIVLCSLSLGIYFLFKRFDINNIKTLREFVEKFKEWGWVVFLLTQVVLSVPIFVVPLEDELWVSLSILLFGAKKGFMLSMLGMALTSFILYMLGRVFGVKLAGKIVGEKALKDAQEKTEFTSKFSLPFLYMIPFFPHDVLCMLSGVKKMNGLYFMIITVFMRSFEIIALCFLGGDFINWKSISLIEWIIIINLIVVDILLLFKLKNCIEKRMTEKRNQKLGLDKDDLNQ